MSYRLARLAGRTFSFAAFVLVCRLALAAVLCLAAGAKLADVGPVAQVWGSAFGVGYPTARLMVVAVAAAEAALAALLVIVAWRPLVARRRLVARAAVAVFALFLLVSVLAWTGLFPAARCGCFGRWDMGGVGWPMFLRNLLLFVMSLVVARE